MLRLIITGECTNAVVIQKRLKIEEQIEVSECTIKRTLRQNGLSSRVKHKKPYFKKNTQNCLYEICKKVSRLDSGGLE